MSTFKALDAALDFLYGPVARHEELGTHCPNCGSTEEMVAFRVFNFSNDGGPRDESWLECVACRARTTNEEMARN